MTTFLTSLWESIFTAGPTPTLLLATNTTFAALQLLLLILFIATYSIHFVALSIICGGLWYAINWFAVEVGRMQREEEEAGGKIQREKAGKGMAGEEGRDSTAAAPKMGVDAGRQESVTRSTGIEASSSSSTTTSGAQQEATKRGVPIVQGDANAPKIKVRGGPSKIMGVMASAKAARGDGGDHDAESLQPGSGAADKGDMSSSSEWEHVSEGER